GEMGFDRNGDGYGDGILQETLNSYEFYEGTSMATPHVAAVAALLLSAGATADEVPGLITSTAKDLGSSGWNTWSGYGLIDPVAALQAIGDAPSPAPEEDEDRDLAPDTTAPVISGVGGERNGTSLTIWWTTDEPASSEIYFDGYGNFGDSSTLLQDHELKFTIVSSETYEFELIAVDAAGNEGRSDRWVSQP
ncbi:MAG: S8 family serine peptidase, partial [Proteobacteria bacterium]|nr:S8 family serine peptidase [Pseudomonadota bacterium]